MRINKYIAQSGFCSRRKADEYIKNGHVRVNDKVITMLGYEIRTKDVVYIDNKKITHDELQYYKFYKPAGYITTKSDEKSRKTIYNIIPSEFHHLKPAGRLDKDTSGLLILSNDGDFLNELTHPSIKVAKVYLATINGKMTQEIIDKMQKGIKIDGKIACADCEIVELGAKESVVLVTLYQGLNRQIRKMFARFSFDVIHLKRIKHATISIDGMKRGDIKPIKLRALKELKEHINKIKEQKC